MRFQKPWAEGSGSLVFARLRYVKNTLVNRVAYKTNGARACAARFSP